MLNLLDVAKIVGCPGDVYLPLSHFAIDSRLVQKGSFFFALKGDHTHGIDHLKEVSEKGGFAALVPEDYEGPDFGLVLLKAKNVLQSLHKLANAYLKKTSPTVIGITGSVGKTSTKECIKHLLQAKYRICATEKNWNTENSMPLAILNASGKEDIFVLEMGMSQPGDIDCLTSIAPPNISVLTPVTYAHAANFNSLEDIAEEKGKILKTCDFSVVHKESFKFPLVQKLCSEKHVIYPESPHVQGPFQATHLQENFQAAYHIAKEFGMSDKEIATISKTLKPFMQRFETKIVKGCRVIDDSYNANALSMIKALQNIPSVEGRKIGVIGSMKELGKFSQMSHEQVGKEALLRLDLVYCLGEECIPIVEIFQKANKPAFLFPDLASLKDAYWRNVTEKDITLIKGSHYHSLWEIL